MFAVVLFGGLGVVLKASSGEESLSNNPTLIKVSESEFDLNTY